jgi:2-polyprenyl-3-methyl-5-hydroxy-6-metoxy-1,4-benzoquinol methylase
MIQLSPLPSPEEHRQFHGDDRQTKNIGRRIEAEELDRRKGWDTARRVKFVAEQVPPQASILDVGSGYGTILGRLAELGYRVRGIELSEERCQISRQLNDVPIMQSDLYALPDEIGRFDAVTLFHVLEHLHEPVRALQALRSRLHPRGCVLIEVPNCEDLLLDASPAYRNFYWQRAHVMYLTTVTLEAVLKKAGFGCVEVHGVQRYGIENLMAWLLHAKPQLDTPSFETQGPYRWLEDLYKAKVQEWKRCDTLMAVASE